MKRSKFYILMALFVALILVPACGEDSNNQNPAEGEGEGETDGGTTEADGGEGEGEGEGEGMNECEQCLQACAGGTCAVSCQALCGSEGEGEGSDPCAENPESRECQAIMTEDFLWFNGIWLCIEGIVCGGDADRATIEVGWWIEGSGVEIFGFLTSSNMMYFQWDDVTQNFTSRKESANRVTTAIADPRTQEILLTQLVNREDGAQEQFEILYRKE